MVRRVEELLSAQPLAPPDVKQLERDLGLAPARLAEILRVMERNGSIVKVAVDLYFLAEAIDTVKAAVGRHLMQHGSMTAATFRDLFGTSRKYAIPLLEYFDRDGLTVRVGDTRQLRERRRVDAG